MNHEQAIQDMVTERYLLDELTPEVRDAFEEHLFECQECTLDVRAGNVFMSEAKAQLPRMAEQSAAQAAARESVLATPVREKRPWWSFLTTPAFAAPVFAALLGVIAFQNASTIPSLRSEATEPRIIAPSSLHADTRGAEPTVVQADRKQGASVLIDLPQQPGYSSYAIDLFDPQGKRIWTRTVAAPQAGTLSLSIPGKGLEQGTYTLNLAGISPQGARTELGRRALDVHFSE